MLDTQLAERKLVGWGAAEVAKEEVILKSPAELQRTSAKTEKVSLNKDKIQALSLSFFTIGPKGNMYPLLSMMEKTAKIIVE